MPNSKVNNYTTTKNIENLYHPGSVLGVKFIAVKKTGKNPYAHGIFISVKGTNQYIN